MDDTQSYHYNVIKRAIALIDAPGGTALTLDDLAAAMGMSAAHFQRVFTAWAGVSPKKVQQYLVLDHARHLLDQHATVLEVAQETGLSGAGRLHDLFVTWQAMTPGDHARRGAGLAIRHGWFDTPFGPALAMATDRGLCALAFADKQGDTACFDDMAARWPKARFIADPTGPAPHVAAIFGAKGDARLHLMGTPFQINVWEALLRVPPGQVTTYGALAAQVCTPRAARAVGAAVGRNPLAFVIPCHRVLRDVVAAKGAALGGYHWGLPRKRAILGWEAARRDALANVT